MNGRVWVCLALLGLRYVFSCCCCSSCCCFFFLPFFAVFNYFCLCMLQLLLLLLLHCSLFAAFSSLAVAQSIYCPALLLLLLRLCFTTPSPSPSPSPFSFLPRHITHVFYWPLATPTAAHLPLSLPTNRLSHLTLCVFSIAMLFNFLARPTTLRKPPGQPHLLQPHPPPLAALLPCCPAAFLGLQFCAIYGYGFSSVNF